MSDESNVLGLPAPTTESFLTRQELADMMRVSLSTLDQMVKEGMPSVTWGRRTRRFRASAAVAWAQARERSVA